ncbi:signal transduction histidine kinase [Kitasatospora sp. GAS204A]|nr:signal transduction histidine kinase [Kitasatospora sp. GAS204B]
MDPAGKPLFDEDESAPLAGFAGQAAVAMQLAERRRDSEQVTLLEERDRIARDLHDLAVQRLFATGMTLQSADCRRTAGAAGWPTSSSGPPPTEAGSGRRPGRRARRS